LQSITQRLAILNKGSVRDMANIFLVYAHYVEPWYSSVISVIGAYTTEEKAETCVLGAEKVVKNAPDRYNWTFWIEEMALC